MARTLVHPSISFAVLQRKPLFPTEHTGSEARPQLKQHLISEANFTWMENGAVPDA